MTDVLLAVGTRKGLFIGRRRHGGLGVRAARTSTRRRCTRSAIDTRRADAPAAGRRRQRPLGPVGVPLRRPGRDLARSPPAPAVKFPKDTGASLERVWQLHPAGPAAPDVVYAGTEPGRAVPLRGRRRDLRAGTAAVGAPDAASSGCRAAAARAVHTVITDPRDARRGDGRRLHGRGVPHRGRRARAGRPSNNGRVGGLPARPASRSSASACTRSPRTPVDPDRLYLQNHWGVYRSDDAGAQWTDIGDGPAVRLRLRRGRPSAPRRTPPTSSRSTPTSDRVPAGHRCRVFRTERRGQELGGRCRAGLPDERPLRHGAAGRAVHGRRRPGGRVLRQPQRRGVRQRGRRRQLAAARLPPAGCAVRAGGGDRLSRDRVRRHAVHALSQ